MFMFMIMIRKISDILLVNIG